MKLKLWHLVAVVLALLFIIPSIVLAIIYSNQDAIIQQQIETVNKDHKGLISVGDVHLAPFKNFPYISIKIDDVQVFESKQDSTAVILDVADIYLGFKLWDIVAGNYDIQTLLVEDGFFNIVLHEDGTNNLQNALATPDQGAEEDSLNIHLQKIKLRNLDIHKFDETTQVDVETFIYTADGSFKTNTDSIKSHVDAVFEMNVINNGDTTYVRHKHFEFHTDFTFAKESGMLTFNSSKITLEHGDFELKGSVDTQNEMTLDLVVQGDKSNFNLLIAFAPEDFIPVLESYNNGGDIYFKAIIQGPTTHGKMPFIDAEFGAKTAFFENTENSKRIDDLGFEGHFTNGKQRNLKHAEFSLTKLNAKLETGFLRGSVFVRNFEEPEVDLSLNTKLNLDFITKFLNINTIEQLSGALNLELKFHDIIDLDSPQHVLNDLNKAYFTELQIENLNLKTAALPAPLEQFNLHLIMEGKQATLDQFDLKLGQSDLSITGYLSDLPAVIHHTSIPVTAHLDIKSKLFDLAELTNFSKADSTGIDEQIEDLKLGFSFVSSAKAFTEFQYLPQGEFFIDSLHAQLKHYPHELHDFHADVLIDDQDLKIVDFTGFIDDSDFHFNGLIHDYKFWLQDTLEGDVDLDLTLKSDLLRLEDIFSYQGENYVPKDYRHEEFDHLVLHANTSMHYRKSNLHSLDLDLDKLSTNMHVHPMRFENFRGHLHYEDEHLKIEKFHGKMGRTVFDVDLNYYLGDSLALKQRDNYLKLKANYIDFDQLFSTPDQAPASEPVKPAPSKTTADVKAHAEAFNLYQLPFTDMQFDFNVNHFIYHRIDLQKIKAHFHTTQNHYLYVDTLSMNAAGGAIDLAGYFNGSDPEHIYFKPKLKLKNVELDKLMFKFENFGQDNLVSENLHGRVSANLNGNLRIYPDLVPDLDHSEIHVDLEVLQGRLENYEYMLMLSDYLGDRNLSNIRFDTLKNHIDITDGIVNIPNMVIESTLGHFELSGTQNMNSGNMQYFFRMPWKVLKQAARYRLFGDKKTTAKSTPDKIVQVDRRRRTRYLNLKITGDFEDYKIGLGKVSKQK